jgi:hypothetical protein
VPKTRLCGRFIANFPDSRFSGHLLKTQIDLHRSMSAKACYRQLRENKRIVSKHKPAFYEQVTLVKGFSVFLFHSAFASAVVCCGCSALLFSAVFLFAL